MAVLNGFEFQAASCLAAVIAKAIDDPHSLTSNEILVLGNCVNNFLEYWSIIKFFSEAGLTDKDRRGDVFNPDLDPKNFGV